MTGREYPGKASRTKSSMNLQGFLGSSSLSDVQHLYYLLLGSPSLIISHLGSTLVPKIPFKMENRKVHFPLHVNLSCSQWEKKKTHTHKNQGSSLFGKDEVFRMSA